MRFAAERRPVVEGEGSGGDVGRPVEHAPGPEVDDSGGATRAPLASLAGVVETALAQALVLAAQAQQWDMVADLTGELAARRQERGALGPAAVRRRGSEGSTQASSGVQRR